MGRQVFTAGEILTAANMNDLSDQSVMVFDDATARTTAIPTPVEGMVTYLKDTDAVEKFNGSAFTAVGGILQVVSTTLDTVFSESVAGSSFSSDVTGLTVSITPSSTSNKIMIFVDAHAQITSVVGGLAWNLRRAGSDIATGVGGVSVTGQTGSATDSAGNTIGISFLDSPATVSSVTYSIRLSNPSGSTRTLFVNRNNSDNFRTISTITAMEVAG